MKKTTVLILIVLLLRFVCLSAYAEDLCQDAADEFGTSAMEDFLTEEEKEISGEINLAGDYDIGGALARLLKSFLTKLSAELKESLHTSTALLALIILCAMATALCSGKDTSFFVELVSCGAAAMLVFGSMDSIVSQTVDAMHRLSDYSKAALPVVFSAAAAGGAISTAAAKFAAVSFALDVLMSISQQLIIPIVYAFLAITVANSMFANPVLSAVQKLCKWIAGTMMTGMTLAFTTYISMIGAIGTAVDTAAVKTARSFISATLPVVGGMISDASAMVLSAAGVIRSCSGVFGLIAVAVMCAGPFAALSVKMLLLKAVAAISDSLQIGKLTALFSGLGSAMSLLLGLLGSCGIMLFISLTAAMKVVTV